MDRVEQTGLGIAVLGHAALFALLSATFLSGQVELPSPPPMDVSLVDEVALTAASPNRDVEPPPSIAPESGPPEDAAPPAPAPEAAAPDPAPPVPKPAPAPPPRPAPAARPQPRQPAPPAPAKATPARPAPQQATRTPARPPAKPTQGTQVAANTTRQRGAILGNDFLKGLTADRTPTQARGEAPRAPTMSAQAAADIGSAIQRQVQPCAERQQLNAPGAERIRVAIRLNLNRDGSLAGRPAVVGHTGVDDDNERYVKRVDDLAIAAFIGCAPLRGLPADLYDVPRGWKVFTLRFKLPS